MPKRLQRAPRAASAGRAAQQAAPEAGGRGESRGARVSDRVLATFTSQLAVLTGAGLSVVRSLHILEGQMTKGAFKAALAEVTEDVEAGSTLSEALGKHPRAFETLYTQMVKAGEAGGILDTVLERLAFFLERAQEVRDKVKGALIYPVVVMVVGTAVVTFVMMFVIPEFQAIFESFGKDLPRPTQLLMDASDFFLQWWYLLFGVPALVFVLLRLLAARNEGFRYRLHALQLRMPVWGRVAEGSMVARFMRTFGTLIQSGVPHLEALDIVSMSLPNLVLQEGIEEIAESVREGEGIARPMGESGVFDDMAVNMVDVGEETGELDAMCLRVADTYEQEVERRTDAALQLLEPILLLLMALGVGYIVFALFLPLLEMMDTLGQI